MVSRLLLLPRRADLDFVIGCLNNPNGLIRWEMGKSLSKGRIQNHMNTILIRSVHRKYAESPNILVSYTQ